MTDNQKIISDYQQKFKDALKGLRINEDSVTDALEHGSSFQTDKIDSLGNPIKHKGYNWNETVEINVPGFEFVEHFGGEGQGDQYWSVFRYDGRYFRISGWYASYQGAEIDIWDWQIVAPKQVQVTEWEAA